MVPHVYHSSMVSMRKRTNTAEFIIFAHSNGFITSNEDSYEVSGVGMMIETEFLAELNDTLEDEEDLHKCTRINRFDKSSETFSETTTTGLEAENIREKVFTTILLTNTTRMGNGFNGSGS